MDTSLWRLVKEGFLKRVARGVFVRHDAGLPELAAIVNAKSEAFGRSVIEHCVNVAANLNFPGVLPNEFVASTDGRSSSFDTIYGRVHTKEVATRKRCLGASIIGQTIRALWYFKVPRFDLTALAARTFGRGERQHLNELIRWMPAWLSRQFVRS